MDVKEVRAGLPPPLAAPMLAGTSRGEAAACGRGGTAMGAVAGGRPGVVGATPLGAAP